MTKFEFAKLYQELLKDDRFQAFVAGLEARFGALDRSVFVPGDPCATAYNEGARSVIVFLRKLEVHPEEKLDDDD